MDSKTKVFRAHRALSWLYGFLGAGVTAAVFLGSKNGAGAEILAIPLLFGVLFAAHHFTARACRDGRPWGRKASIAIACLMLLGVPMGTLIGIYLLVNTWKPWPVGEVNV